jgi:hypothetical protein
MRRPLTRLTPESAALELIVQLPAQLLATNAFTAVLQDFCGLLHAERAFTGLSWNDARQIAAVARSLLSEWIGSKSEAHPSAWKSWGCSRLTTTAESIAGAITTTCSP